MKKKNYRQYVKGAKLCLEMNPALGSCSSSCSKCSIKVVDAALYLTRISERNPTNMLPGRLEVKFVKRSES